MKKILQRISLIGVTLFLFACNNENANTEDNRISLIEEVIMESEYGNDIEKISYVIKADTLQKEEKYDYDVDLTLKDNIMKEYSPLKLGEILESFPMIIDENLILENDIQLLDGNNDYEIIEYSIWYNGGQFKKTEYGLTFMGGKLFNPIAEQESRNRQKQFIEETRKRREENKHT